jgi:hypothetical protein
VSPGSLFRGRFRDCGAGDGGMSYFAESPGCPAVAVDSPLSNYNGMRGLRALQRALHFNVEPAAADFDPGWKRDGRFHTAWMAGLLYHRRNPFAFPEATAQACRRGILSTRMREADPRQARAGRPSPLSAKRAN